MKRLIENLNKLTERTFKKRIPPRTTIMERGAARKPFSAKDLNPRITLSKEEKKYIKGLRVVTPKHLWNVSDDSIVWGGEIVGTVPKGGDFVLKAKGGPYFFAAQSGWKYPRYVTVLPKNASR